MSKKNKMDVKTPPPEPETGEVKGVKGLLTHNYGEGRAWTGEKAAQVITKMSLDEAGNIAKGLTFAGRWLPVVGNIASGFSAWTAFKNHHYVQAGLYALGMLPWPVGAVGLGAAYVYDILGIGNTHYPLWAAPDGQSTWILPGEAHGVGGVSELDGQLRTAQNAVFGFQDGPSGTVWGNTPPQPIRLDAPQVKTELTQWLDGVSGQADQILSLMSRVDEPYFTRARDQLRGRLEELKRLGELDQKIHTQLAAASKAADTWYTTFKAENKLARMSLANHGELSGTPGLALQSKGSAAAEAITAANDALTKLVDPAGGPAAATLPASLPAPTPAPTPTPQPKDQNDPGRGGPGGQNDPLGKGAAGADTGTEEKKEEKKDEKKPDDALNNLLASALRPPLGGGAPLGGLGGGMPLGGMPLGGMPLGATPLGAGLGNAAAAQKPVPLTDAARAERKVEPEPKPLTALAGDTKPQPATVPQPLGAPQPQAPQTPQQPQPQAKGGQPQPQPAAAAPSTTVKVGGKDVNFPDQKTAALAKELANSAPGKSVSIADAAARAGLMPPVPGQDPGQQVAPADARPGDILRAGDRTYLNLGEGRFLDPTDGRVLTADQLPKSLGQDGGYFRLVDGSANPAVAQPASGGAPAFPVGDQQQTVPPAGGQPPAGTPPAVPAVPPVGGTPGVPAKGGTPIANAAATDNGLPGATPATVGQRVLNPNNVK